MTKGELQIFEARVAKLFREGRIHAPIHLSGGNEDELIRIFREIGPEDWVLSTWRSHYHALLKGIPPTLVMEEILAGRSMMLHFPAYKFLTSAIVGGILPIACGLAASGSHVWVFVGDMAASTGHFHDAIKFAEANALPIHFVVEDNGLSTNTPTEKAWARGHQPAEGPASVHTYNYKRTYPHYGINDGKSF